jgi:hypothetical protein
MRSINRIKRKIRFHCPNCDERIEERLGLLVEIDRLACPNLGCPGVVDLKLGENAVRIQELVDICAEFDKCTESTISSRSVCLAETRGTSDRN